MAETVISSFARATVDQRKQFDAAVFAGDLRSVQMHLKSEWIKPHGMHLLLACTGPGVSRDKLAILKLMLAHGADPLENVTLPTELGPRYMRPAEAVFGLPHPPKSLKAMTHLVLETLRRDPKWRPDLSHHYAWIANADSVQEKADIKALAHHIDRLGRLVRFSLLNSPTWKSLPLHTEAWEKKSWWLKRDSFTRIAQPSLCMRLLASRKPRADSTEAQAKRTPLWPNLHSAAALS